MKKISFCWICLLLLTVNHQILLSTLSSLDITGIPLHWFESYLTGRSFKVAWGGEVSKAHQLVSGVSQGSVHGPPLHQKLPTELHYLARFFYNYPIKFSQKSWGNFPSLSKSTLQRLLDLAGLHYTTSERSGPF